jgi:hypothetical protein
LEEETRGLMLAVRKTMQKYINCFNFHDIEKYQKEISGRIGNKQ